jgi:hypothetical protein
MLLRGSTAKSVVSESRIYKGYGEERSYSPFVRYIVARRNKDPMPLPRPQAWKNPWGGQFVRTAPRLLPTA